MPVQLPGAPYNRRIRRFDANRWPLAAGVAYTRLKGVLLCATVILGSSREFKRYAQAY
jgi:hypothetical protein